MTMGVGFWDQVNADAALLIGGSEVSMPVVILDGTKRHDAFGIFELSYREIAGESLEPIPSRYAALRVYEKSMPIRITVGMGVIIDHTEYRVSSIREPGLDGVTTLELVG